MKKSIKFLVYSFLLVSVIACDKSTSSPPEGPPVVIDGENRLPQVVIITNGEEIVDEPKINAEMTISVNGEIDYDGAVGIEIRGSSSQTFPKKQFGFETRDASNEDLDVSLLNFPEEEDWILNAPYSDKSLVRNILIYDLSRDIGRYASRAKFVDVTINTTYNGVYVLLEKLKRDDNRIDINKLKEDENSGEDLTGGYILKIDKPDSGAYNDQNAITSTVAPMNANAGQQIHFLYDTPDEDDITVAQKTYISTYMNDFEIALSGSNFTSTTTGYPAYIDTASFIDFFLLNELANNVDGYRISTWLVKDKNEKLKMGPIWDFNLAFGNANYCGGGETDVWAYKFNERCPGDPWQVPFWWSRLLEDPSFVAQVQARWSALRANELSNSAILGKIDAYETTLTAADAINTNFGKWPIFGFWVWPNNFVGQTYAEEKNYLTSWITDRVAWLDSEIAGL